MIGVISLVPSSSDLITKGIMTQVAPPTEAKRATSRTPQQPTHNDPDHPPNMDGQEHDQSSKDGAQRNPDHRLVIRAGAPLFASILAFNALIMLIVMPVLNWIFEEALRSAGMVTLALRQIQETGAIHLRALAAPLKDAWKRLWKPSSYALLAYLLILLPLLGAGFISVLELGIAIPPFITGELMKTPALAMIIRALHLIALYVALRLSLAVAVFVRTSESGWDAMKTSWRLTAGWRCCLSCRKSSRGPQFLT